MKNRTPLYLSLAVILGLVVSLVSLARPAPAEAETVDLLLSEYIEGSSFNKAVEVYNGTGADAVLSEYVLELYTNGSATASQSLNLGTIAASLANGDVLVLAHPSANAAILAVADGTSSTVINFNGDDAVALRRNGVIVDVLGQIGFDPGSEWGAGLTSTADNSLRRQAAVCQGDVDGSNLFDPADEWDGFAADTFDGLGAHTANCGGGDIAPQVVTTDPLDGAANVAIDANLSVTFSEDVNASAASFVISCSASGAHTAVASGGPVVFTLDPDADFANAETCAVTVLAAQVTDLDTNDPPDNLAADYAFSFSTVSAALPAALVINEIDYDQPGTDAAEFVEIRNNDANPVDLSAYSLEMINGSGGGAASYQLFALPAISLAPGDYFVVCANAATVANCDLDVSPDTNLIQNGAPDAVALLFNGTVFEAVSYEGDTAGGYTEGSGAGLDDTAAAANQGLSRLPDGADTNVNNVDLSLVCVTPGRANSDQAIDCQVETAPAVVSTNPADGSTSALVDANVDITFSEPVTVSGGWFSLICATSGAHSAVVSGGPTSFGLDPGVNFVGGESCALTIVAAQVSDVDTDDPPDTMAADYVANFTIAAGNVCEMAYTPIYAIQGSGSSAAITGNVTTQGVVVGDFEGANDVGLQGFYLQDLAGDGDGATSDGIFVFTGSNNLVSAGQLVRVTGYARERFDQTALNGSNSNSAVVPAGNIVDCGASSVAPTDVMMPLASPAELERFEGMLVRFPQALVISEYFNYERFGEMALALPLEGEPRPFTGTAIDEPGAAANTRTLANSLRRVTLDDGLGAQNPPLLRHPNGGYFSLDNRFRGGDIVQNVTGVIGFDFSLYRIQPVGPADYAAANPRSPAPGAVGGSLRVAAMNTLNFFLTPDNIQEGSNDPDDPADNLCGPVPSLECRGFDGDQPLEFDRQRVKLLAALAGLDADIIGLNELENTIGVDPLGDPTNGVVAGLNDLFGPGTYAYIDTGVIGTDAIRVGLIYRPAKAQPVGGFQVLTTADDPRFLDTKNRPALAQTFVDLSTGQRFTVVVNHLKSKGSSCNDVGDPDLGDGQGNCSVTRTLAAQALVDWLATDPTGSGDPDFLIMGDLNSYAQEDPIDAVRAGPDDMPGTGDDYTNLIAAYQGAFAYSYVFDGQLGYLDHALANPTMAGQVTGAADWHINADEPDLLDYDTTFKPPEQEAIFEPNGYRSSDHDPVVVGLSLVPQCQGRNATVYVGPDGRIVGGLLAGLIFNGTLTGTEGDDVIVGTAGGELIFALAGDDVVCALDGTDAVTGGLGNDILLGGEGNDTLVGLAGSDTLDAGGGNDTVFGDGGADVLHGGAGKDVLFAGEGDDELDGGADKDLMEGGAGADVLRGGDDDDIILGGPGNDQLDGNDGRDTCNGGAGTDSAENCEKTKLIP